MARGVVTFTFDDGYEAVYQNALPILEKYNFKGVFAIPLNFQKLEQTEGTKARPWMDWLEIKNRGHEVAAHSVNHVNLTELSTEKLDQELKEPQEKLQATTLVYPGGAFNDAASEAARKYYSAARTVKRGFESLPPQNPMQLRSYNWTRHNFSAAKANLLALWAYLTNSWLIETFHMVSDSDIRLVHTVREVDLDKHLKFVAKLPVTVKTIHEAISGHYHQERGG
ncbi:MAG: polysaccharide deacetylase family protein [Patescibacteria group bacterium]